MGSAPGDKQMWEEGVPSGDTGVGGWHTGSRMEERC